MVNPESENGVRKWGAKVGCESGVQVGGGGRAHLPNLESGARKADVGPEAALGARAWGPVAAR